MILFLGGLVYLFVNEVDGFLRGLLRGFVRMFGVIGFVWCLVEFGYVVRSGDCGWW